MQQSDLDHLISETGDEHLPLPKFQVEKLAAARCILRAAIRAWFANEDPLPVHALASAAHEVLYNFARHRGLEDALFDSPKIKPEYRNVWHQAVRAPANFLKHADRDPEGKLEFDPTLNDLRLLYCLLSLKSLGKQFDDIELACTIRIALEYPDLLTQPLHEQTSGSTPEDWGQLARVSRPRYLKIDQAVRAAAKAGLDLRIGGN